MPSKLETFQEKLDLRHGLALALALIAISLAAGPGLVLGKAVLVNAAAVIAGVAVIVVARTRPGRRHDLHLSGQWTVALFAAFVALSGFSIIWSVEPSATWDELNRLLGYFAAFAGAVVAARTFPQRWPAVILGLAVASVVMSLIAIASKISPELLSPREINARLREPLEYWNAVGLVAAFGVPLWLYYGTRRTGRPVLDILAAPALMVLFVTLMLTYSRGALIAALVATIIWFAFAPRRLQSAALLVAPLLGALIVVLWAFAQPDLTTDEVDLLVRETAGHRLGVVFFGTMAVVTALSLLTQFMIATRAQTRGWRRRAGIVLVTGVMIVPIGGAVALSQSDRGLGGTISHGWTQLTDPDATTVAGSLPGNSPDRLAQVGSARSGYWRDAIRIFKEQPVFGVGANGYGAARLKVRTDTYDAAHAHGFLVQVAADLGLTGVLITLAMFGAWLVAARRTLGRRTEPWPSERLALFALAAAVLAYGVHSFIDWTWSIPATTLPALIAAGWVAGRGVRTELPDPRGDTPPPGQAPTTRREQVMRWLPIAQPVVLGLLALWSITQPYRAFHTSQNALAAIERGDIEEAVELSKKAVKQDPVSLDTHAVEATALAAGGDIAGARKTIEEAVALQPRNPAAWVQLLTFELGPAADPERAAAAYRAAVYLDPYSPTLRRRITQALTEQTVDVPLEPGATVDAPFDEGTGAPPELPGQP